MSKIQIGQGINNQGTFYIVPNQMNGIVCRNFKIAKRVQTVLGKFQNINEGIATFNYLAFHECPEPELLPNGQDNYDWALKKMEEGGVK